MVDESTFICTILAGKDTISQVEKTLSWNGVVVLETEIDLLSQIVPRNLKFSTALISTSHSELHMYIKQRLLS